MVDIKVSECRAINIYNFCVVPFVNSRWEAFLLLLQIMQFCLCNVAANLHISVYFVWLHKRSKAFRMPSETRNRGLTSWERMWPFAQPLASSSRWTPATLAGPSCPRTSRLCSGEPHLPLGHILHLQKIEPRLILQCHKYFIIHALFEVTLKTDW